MRKNLTWITMLAMLLSTSIILKADVVLKQNWQAGQQLVYNTKLNGTLNLQIPQQVPIIIAGIPLEIDLSANSKTTFNTLSVDEAGNGTVRIQNNPINIQGSSLGQNAVIKVQNGKSEFTLNGAKQNALPFDASILTNPPAAVTFTPQMKVKNIGKAQSIFDSAAAVGNISGMVQNVLLSVLPALLPEGTIKTGDSWSAPVEYVAPGAKEVTRLGELKFNLKGEEKSGERTVQKIGVEGEFKVASEQIAPLKNKLPANNSQVGMLNQILQNSAVSGSQSIAGDLFFDAVAGQLVKADLKLESSMQAKPTDENENSDEGYADFDGTLKLDLAQVIKSAA